MSLPAAYSLRSADPIAAGELGRACGVGPTVGQLLLQRQLASADEAKAFLDPTLASLTPPAEMADRDAAADRIASALRRRERIVVFGDYDVDGMTAAVILADALEAFGGDVSVLVADRFGGGYGFSNDALERCRAVSPGLIITCDCGSSDHARIEAARQSGIDVVVVDHHLVPEEPLPALAFINPHRPDCGFPYKGMASAGLVFSLAAAVRRMVGSKVDLRPFLDLVALGTVADVAPLDGDNRRLVRAGLGTLMETGRPGLRALFDVISIRSPIGASDIAFRIAPRLNAPGRLGAPERTLAMLRARNAEEARPLALQVEAENDKRKQIEREVTREALAQVEEVYGDDLPPGLVVAKRGWHRGVVGITAARLVDKTQRPALVIGIQDGVGHGSGRTVDGCSVHAALSSCASELLRFGGHAAAVGLTMEEERVDALRASFADACGTLRRDATIQPREVDVAVDGNQFPVPSVRDLWRMEPVGEGNREPLFALQDVPVQMHRRVGSDGQHLKLTLTPGGKTLSAFGFELGQAWNGTQRTLNAVGRFRFNHYDGGRSVEFRIEDLWD